MVEPEFIHGDVLLTPAKCLARRSVCRLSCPSGFSPPTLTFRFLPVPRTAEQRGVDAEASEAPYAWSLVDPAGATGCKPVLVVQADTSTGSSATLSWGAIPGAAQATTLRVLRYRWGHVTSE